MLSGAHPFNRKTSLIAREQGLTPALIPGLGRTRMQALNHALALHRDERTPSVSRFLAELYPRRTWGPKRWVLAVALLVLIAAVFVLTTGWRPFVL